MERLLGKLFLEHPASVDESYWQHLCFAAMFSSKLAMAACAALIHAFVPCLCEKTASTILKDLVHRMDNR